MIKKFLCNSIDIDLSSSLDGGQSFRWHKFENGFHGVINNKPYFIFQKNKKIFVESEEINNSDMDIIVSYLSLDFDLKKLFSSRFWIHKFAIETISFLEADFTLFDLLKENTFESTMLDTY